jgi:hypothetical protein
MTKKSTDENPHETAWQKRLYAWHKRHKVLVIVLSSMTVLSSFVVKETLDEPAKDTLSSIKSAIQDNNNEQAGLYTQLTDIDSNLAVIKSKLLDAQQPGADQIQITQLHTDITKTLELLGQNESHLVVLGETLSPDFKRKKEAFEDKYRAVQSAPHTDSVEGLTKWLNDWKALYDDSRIIRGEGVKELMELEEKTEGNHHLYNWLAYVSFGLGWIVGLGSSIADGKGGSAHG